MNTYDVVCPICGTVNYNLFLEETDGLMECENCGNLIQSHWMERNQKPIPVFVTPKLQVQNAPAEWDMRLERGLYHATQTAGFMALEAFLLPQLPPINTRLWRQGWHNADDLRQLQIRYNLRNNGTQTWPHRCLCTMWSRRKHLTIECNWHTDGLVEMKQAM